MDFDINSFEEFRIGFEALRLQKDENVSEAVQRLLNLGYTYVWSEDSHLLLGKAHVYSSEYLQRIQDTLIISIPGDKLKDELIDRRKWYEEEQYDDFFLQKLIKNYIISEHDVEKCKEDFNILTEHFLCLIQETQYYSVAQYKYMSHQYKRINETTPLAGAYLQFGERAFLSYFDELPLEESLVAIQNAIINLETEANYSASSDVVREAISNGNAERIRLLKKLKKKKKQEAKNRILPPTQDVYTPQPALTNETIEYTIRFKPEIVDDLFSFLKDYFPSGQQEKLRSILNTGKDVNSKLSFRGNGNRLADAFRRLFEDDIITGCSKKGLERWLCSNFEYRWRDQNKSFTEDYAEKCISRNSQPCKSPLPFKIDKGIIVRT